MKKGNAGDYAIVLKIQDKFHFQEIGEEKMLMLIRRLAADHRFDEIERIKDDKNYRAELYKGYHIV